MEKVVKKYKSKYANLSMEERKDKYLENIRGHCEKCNKDYTNLKLHFISNTHNKFPETEEERIKKQLHKKQVIKDWKQKAGNEVLYGYLHGQCEKCNHYYANIYEHNKTKKHLNKL